MNIVDDNLTRMMRTFKNEAEFNYSVHISEAMRFVFFSNPICACSTLKASLNISTAAALGIDFAIRSAADIHKRRSNLLLSPKTVGYDRFKEMLASANYLKFAFIRDPVSRFCSAYYKKLRRENAFTQRVRGYLNIPQEIPLESFLTLETFAEFVYKDQVLRDLDEHWRLQRAQICFDHIPDLQIGRVENFEDDAQRLLSTIFGKGRYKIFSADQLNPHNSSRLKQRYTDIALGSRANIESAYADDYNMIKLLSG